jgi:hypothetical protein
MRICYSFPSRSRPSKFFDALHNIRALSASQNYFVIAKLDQDDPTMNDEEVRSRMLGHPEVTIKWGFSDNKIHAINRDLEDLPPCDIIIVMSDDMVWEKFGFDDEIREAFNIYFPQFDGVIHYPEKHSANRTMVLTIMGVNLYRLLGYLYYPKYESVYADNDLTEMTRKMKKYVFVNQYGLYRHLHPIYGDIGWDSQYRHSERPAVYKKDREVFMRRQANNFGL